MVPELNIVQYHILNSLLLLLMQNQFSLSSNVQQEMEFQIVSTLQVTSCIIASLTYTSRAKTLCYLLPLEFYITIIKAKPILLIILFPMWNRKQIFNLVVGNRINHVMVYGR